MQFNTREIMLVSVIQIKKKKTTKPNNKNTNSIINKQSLLCKFTKILKYLNSTLYCFGKWLMIPSEFSSD